MYLQIISTHIWVIMLKFEPISQPKSHFQFMLKKLKKLKQLMLDSKISTLEFNFFNVDPPPITIGKSNQ